VDEERRAEQERGDRQRRQVRPDPGDDPILPRMIITPLTRTAGPANGILLAAA
jgi:hypothetical protein